MFLRQSFPKLHGPMDMPGFQKKTQHHKHQNPKRKTFKTRYCFFKGMNSLTPKWKGKSFCPKMNSIIAKHILVIPSWSNLLNESRSLIDGTSPHSCLAFMIRMEIADGTPRNTTLHLEGGWPICLYSSNCCILYTYLSFIYQQCIHYFSKFMCSSQPRDPNKKRINIVSNNSRLRDLKTIEEYWHRGSVNRR